MQVRGGTHGTETVEFNLAEVYDIPFGINEGRCHSED